MAKRNETAPSLFVPVAALVVAVVLAAQVQPAVAGSYTYTPAMQETVKAQVQKASDGYRGVLAALIRLLFHDCWVKGCDGSVLLESTPHNGTYGTEKNASSNIGLGGFEVIDGIKKELGDGVSCADIVVFAAREATFILSNGKIDYTVRGGRGDGVYSSAKYADEILPPPTFKFTQLRDNFASKGFDAKELVVLSGAHAVGVAHYESFKDRLRPDAIGEINLNYQLVLGKDALVEGTTKPKPDATVENNIRDMDAVDRTAAGYNAAGVDTAAKGVLDNSYYTANLQNMVVFNSDWELTQDKAAKDDLEEYKNNADRWNSLFGDAMAKLSKLTADAGARSEIRKNCRTTNQK